MRHADAIPDDDRDLNQVELTATLADDPRVLWTHDTLWVGFLVRLQAGWLPTPDIGLRKTVYLVKGVATDEPAQRLLSWPRGTGISIIGSLDFILGGDVDVPERPRWELAVRAHTIERCPQRTR